MRAAIRAPRETLDCLVVGAGVVGLAIARQLALDGRNVVMLESASAIGTGTSSRNSQVIHAGIYYPIGSLKAALCVGGSKALYSYCAERLISHRRVGKLIVATSEHQVQTLQRLQQTGVANGVSSLHMLNAADAMRMEPELRCIKALWSPSTGIIDVHALMLSLQADAEEQQVAFALNRIAIGGMAAAGGRIDVYIHETSSSRGSPTVDLMDSLEMVLSARCVINSAGLHATAFARAIEGVKPESIPTSYFAKGNYFVMPAGNPPFSRLIYPVPEEGGLGIHLTLDIGGGTRYGPDVEWLPNNTLTTCVTTEFDYSVDPSRAPSFYSEISKYYPALPEGCLRPDYAGIRAKLKCGDFLIQGEAEHGVPGLINLYGIESPGLTACLEMAKRVSLMLRKA